MARTARGNPALGDYGPCDYCSGVGCDECCSARDLKALHYYRKHGRPLIDEFPPGERKAF